MRTRRRRYLGYDAATGIPSDIHQTRALVTEIRFGENQMSRKKKFLSHFAGFGNPLSVSSLPEPLPLQLEGGSILRQDHMAYQPPGRAGGGDLIKKRTNAN